MGHARDEAIKILRGRGWTDARIAEAFDVSRQRIHQLKRAEPKPQPAFRRCDPDRDGFENTLRREFAYICENAPARGGHIYEGARPAFEAGEYHDAYLREMLDRGWIKPHPDPDKGWIVAAR